MRDYFGCPVASRNAISLENGIRNVYFSNEFYGNCFYVCTQMYLSVLKESWCNLVWWLSSANNLFFASLAEGALTELSAWQDSAGFEPRNAKTEQWKWAVSSFWIQSAECCREPRIINSVSICKPCGWNICSINDSENNIMDKLHKLLDPVW